MTGDRHWWETDVVLADGGTVHLRPRRHEDADRIADLYSRMSAASRYLRFAGATSAEQAGTLETRPEVDYDHHFSVVAELRGNVVGVASYFRTPDDEAEDEAEVAFAVDDREQGRGLGTLMLEYLVAVARERGIHRFVAWVLTDNHQMLRVFSAAGFDVHKRWGGGLIEIRFDIEPTPGSLSALRAREHSSEVRSVERLLCPSSIAVVGANREPGSIGHAVFRNLLDGDFVGPVYPVNPHAGAVAGVKAYPRVTDIPDPVDVAVIATPAATVLDVLDDCVAKGVEGLVVISAGFAEIGDATDREGELVRRARANGMRLIGPNCMGVVNTDPAVRMNATFAASRPVAGRVAFASQSGGLGIALLGQGADRGLGISAFVSMGNKADVSSNDLIQYWEDDPNTDVILLYLESFGNPRKFARLARRISRTKPIVAVKSGRTPAGARGTASHTAALATPDVAVDALFRQAGVVRVETLAELFDAATLLSHQPLPAGRRVAIVSNGGGPGILAADACVAVGLEVVELSAGTQAALQAITPPGAGLRNPVDLVASAAASVYEEAIRIVLADADVDAVVVLFVPPLVTAADDVAQAIVAASEPADGVAAKPVLACFLVPEGTVDVVSADGSRRIPTFGFPEAAAVALERAARLAEWRSRPEGTVPALPGIDLDRARTLVAEELAETSSGWIAPVRIRQLLECFGITMVPTVWVGHADAAMQAADDAGYPVALKAGASDLVHKSDVGGVRLNLRDAEAVRGAFTTMHDALGDAMGGAVVQPMVTSGGVETILGITGDTLFGSLVLFGMGGVQAELLRDTAVRFVPLTDVDAQDLVRSLRSSPLLFGYRNTPEVDVAALEETLLRIGLLAEHVPEVAEFDANPVIASPSGTVVVDAKLRLVHVAAEPPPELRRLRPPP